MRRISAGFTIVELVVVIVVLAVLSGFAVPRFMALDKQARIAAVQGLAGTLQSTAYQVRALCMASAATSGCDLGSSSWQGTINGKGYWLNYGWPDAGDELASRQIDALIDYSGFRAYLVGPPSTRFVRDDAPTPDRCSVTYFDAYYLPQHYQVAVDTSGC
ncbi:MAG: prepilin-type N-terminal cleavage/methylation domain-containing protein [Proteobacteria bacterium]|nr:prepilin-type N-terminal cleavage/methylation domain-containing protein [Pseudomonadota bacterium]